MGLPVFGTETYTNSLKQLERLTHQMTATFVCVVLVFMETLHPPCADGQKPNIIFCIFLDVCFPELKTFESVYLFTVCFTFYHDGPY